MENFDGAPGKVKEKSVYLLHLDTPRIIIISCVVIGIVIVSFLLGMNFIKSDSKTDVAQTSLNIDEPRLPDAGKTPLPGDGDTLNSLDRPPAGDDRTAAASDPLAKKDNADILTGENIKEIIPPADRKTSSEEKAKLIAEPLPTGKPEAVSHDKPGKKKIASADKKNHKKKDGKQNAARKGVVAVSSPVESHRALEGGFMIQVASYDNKPRAQEEVKYLRTKQYDAFIADTTVSGKKYFRVRIGPLADREKAIGLLHDMQTDKRYEESYLVKE